MSDKQMSNLAKMWEGRIQQWLQTKKTLAAWSQENDFVYSQSHYWKSRFSDSEHKKIETPTKGGFFELENEAFSDSGIIIEVDAVQVHISTKFDQQTFLKCINLLKREVC